MKKAPYLLLWNRFVVIGASSFTNHVGILSVPVLLEGLNLQSSLYMYTIKSSITGLNIQLNLVISNSLISNNRLSRSENLVPVLSVPVLLEGLNLQSSLYMYTIKSSVTGLNIQLNLVISNSLISNNRLSRSENLVPV